MPSYVIKVVSVTPEVLPVPDVYVSTSGNDSTGDGSKGSPYRTVKFGVESADPGQTVGIEAGEYSNENCINPPANVTVRPVSGAAVTIVGDNTSANACRNDWVKPVFEITQNGVTIDGSSGANGYMTIKGGWVGAIIYGYTESAGVPNGGTLKNLYFDQRGADRCQSDDNAAGGVWYHKCTGAMVAQDLFIHGGDFTSSNKANNHGIVSFGGASPDITLTRISLIDPSGTLGNAIRDKHGNAGATNRIVEDCYIDMQGSGQTHQQACIMLNSPNYTVRRNYMNRAGGSGYGLWVREGSGGFCTPNPATILARNNSWNGAQASRAVNDFVDGGCGGSPNPWDEYFDTDGSNAFGTLEAGAGVIGGAAVTGASFEPGITGR